MVEVGRFGLWLVVLAAAVAVARPWGRTARWALRTSATGGVIAVSALAAMLARGDWSVAYVVDHSRDGLGPGLRMAGLWAGPQGSFLLWSTLTAVTVAVTHRAVAPAARPVVARLGAVVVLATAAVQVAALDPFTRLEVPAITGLGLQPVLEHPAMVWHPPLLYAGLVGMWAPVLVLVGARAGAGVEAWPAVRAAAAAPLALLAAGLATGGRWAYAELGWGGYWGWDPIENLALVAWATGLVVLHWPVRRWPRWAGVAVAVPALVATWGAVLTRTGAVTSVHAFSDRPGLSTWLLAQAVVVTVVLAVAASARPAAPVGVAADAGDPGSDGAGRAAAPLPARTWGAGVGAAVAVVVASGVVAPLLWGGGDGSAVAGSYFTRALLPVAVAGSVVLVATGRRRWAAVWPGAVVGGGLAGIAGAVPAGVVLATAAGAVAGESLGWLARRPGQRPAALAHLGLAVLLVGVAGTTGRQDAMTTVADGGSATVAGVRIASLGVSWQERGGVRVVRATVQVDGRTLHPAIAAHQRRRVRTNEFAQLLRPWDEVQVALVDGGGGAATYRVIRHPLLPLVWVGSALVALGTGLAAAPRRAPSAEPARRAGAGAVAP